eukprot:1361404-Prymnesium_polylepis.1
MEWRIARRDVESDSSTFRVGDGLRNVAQRQGQSTLDRFSISCEAGGCQSPPYGRMRCDATATNAEI